MEYFKKRTEGISQLFLETANRLATDSRDKVFALLGLVT
jgi:hypothetical protein